MTDTDDSADDLISPRERAELIRASFAHLLDLKRHGHSPRFCELFVDPRSDKIIALPQSRPKQGPRPKPVPIVQPLFLRKRP